MTEEELATIRKRSEELGQNAWNASGELNGKIGGIGPLEGYDGDALDLDIYSDADLIEAIRQAPSDIHSLLAEVDRQRKALAEFRWALKEMMETYEYEAGETDALALSRDVLRRYPDDETGPVI